MTWKLNKQKFWRIEKKEGELQCCTIPHTTEKKYAYNEVCNLIKSTSKAQNEIIRS